MSKKIRLELRSFDKDLLSKNSFDVGAKVSGRGALVVGPISVPNRKKKFTVNRSPHVDGKSREQFQIILHKQFFDIYITEKTRSGIMEVFSELSISCGVELFIKDTV